MSGCNYCALIMDSWTVSKGMLTRGGEVDIPPPPPPSGPSPALYKHTPCNHAISNSLARIDYRTSFFFFVLCFVLKSTYTCTYMVQIIIEKQLCRLNWSCKRSSFGQRVLCWKITDVNTIRNSFFFCPSSCEQEMHCIHLTLLFMLIKAWNTAKKYLFMLLFWGF